MSESELAKRFDASNPNMAIWLKNEPTDVFVSPGSDNKVIKDFNRGGFKGKSANPTYVVKRLTAEFGSLGKGWGYEIENEQYVEGEPITRGDIVLCREVVHILRIRFWYMSGGEKCSFPQFGQTTFIGRTQHGPKTDEEAPKKSLTDAIVKAASWLGFVSDIHMGMWDDSKYVNNAVALAEDDRATRAKADLLAKPYAFVNSKGEVFLSKTAIEWRDGWFSRIDALAKQSATKTIHSMWEINAPALESTRAVDPATCLEVEQRKDAALNPEQKGAAAPAGITLPPDTAGKDQSPPADPAPTASNDREYPTAMPEALLVHAFNDKGALIEYSITKGKNKVEDVWLAALRRAVSQVPTVEKMRAFTAKNQEWVELVTHFHPAHGDLARTALAARTTELDAAFPGDIK